jgi:hypothetical protein
MVDMREAATFLAVHFFEIKPTAWNLTLQATIAGLQSMCDLHLTQPPITNVLRPRTSPWQTF